LPKFIDMTGMKFGKWTVIELAEPLKDYRGYNVHRWKCRCECGNVRDVIGTTLRSGASVSCGCHVGHRADKARELFSTHGESKTRLYKIWNYMRKRCNNPNVQNYSDYGGRGIKVCDEWNESYETFRDWSIAHGYDDTLSIDRIDVNGNYEPKNCRWATWTEQANNRTNTRYLTYKGKTMSVSDWAKELGMPYKKLYKRVYLGWSAERALTT
jgi:hypothetical protein